MLKIINFLIQIILNNFDYLLILIFELQFSIYEILKIFNIIL